MNAVISYHRGTRDLSFSSSFATRGRDRKALRIAEWWSWSSSSERRGRWRSALARERAAKVGGSSVGFREPRLGRVATGNKPERRKFKRKSEKISRTSMKWSTAIPSGGHRTHSRGPHSPSYNTVEGGDVDVPLKLQNGT